MTIYCVLYCVEVSAINETAEVKDITNQNDEKTDNNATPTEETSQKEDDTQLLKEQEEKRAKLREERNEISRQVI